MTTKGFTNSTPPPPPNGLSRTQCALWNETVNSFPDEWFRASDIPLLTELVRAHDMSNVLAKKIRGCKDLAKLKLLLEMRDRECRRAASLATKMRVPPQSRSDRHVAGVAARNSGLPEPWEESGRFVSKPGRMQ